MFIYKSLTYIQHYFLSDIWEVKYPEAINLKQNIDLFTEYELKSYLS